MSEEYYMYSQLNSRSLMVNFHENTLFHKQELQLLMHPLIEMVTHEPHS
jgi:hypothetical protein